MPHRNWPAICGIKDDVFRLLVATTKDEYILTGLQSGFPDLFSEESTPLRVPASVLRKAAQEWSREEYQEDTYVDWDSELCWVHVLDKFNIPIVFDGAAPDSGLSKAHIGIPQDILQQLVGQRFEMGLRVDYNGIRCLVIDIGLKRSDAIRLHEVITETPEVEWIRMIAADCVDLNS